MKVLSTKFHIWQFKNCYITKESEAKAVIKKLIESPQKLYGLDLETIPLEKYKGHPKAGLCPLLSDIRLCQIYNGEGHVYIFDVLHLPISNLSDLFYAKKFIAHNAVFELSFLTHKGFPNMSIGCSMLMSQLIYNSEHSPFESDSDIDWEDIPKSKRVYHSLQAVVKRYYDIWISKEGQTSDWSGELTNDQLIYAGLDAFLTYQVGVLLIEKIAGYKMLQAYSILKNCQHVVVQMQLNGLGVDWEAHDRLITIWEEKLKLSQEKCKPFFGTTNLNSSPQMNKWLLDYCKDKPQLLKNWPQTLDDNGNPSGRYSFSHSQIFSFKSLPPIEALFSYKKYAKLVNTFGKPFRQWEHPATHRIHTSFTLGQTVTGRMSSREPNLQQCPRVDPRRPKEEEMRYIFVPTKGKAFVIADFGQIELRVQAEISGDPVMRKVFEKGEDIYCAMASAITGRTITKKDKEERHTGKALMLSLGYGMGALKLKKKVAEQYEIILTDEQAKNYRDTYHKTFKVYSKWCDAYREKCKQLGFSRTRLGRMRKILEDEVYTKGPNNFVQGSSFDLLALSMLDIYKQGFQTCCVIHDELIIECDVQDIKKTCEAIKNCMEIAMLKLFPHAATQGLAEPNYGYSWAEAK